jgi:hypothetical protein
MESGPGPSFSLVAAFYREPHKQITWPALIVLSSGDSGPARSGGGGVVEAHEGIAWWGTMADDGAVLRHPVGNPKRKV